MQPDSRSPAQEATPPRDQWACVHCNAVYDAGKMPARCLAPTPEASTEPEAEDVCSRCGIRESRHRLEAHDFLSTQFPAAPAREASTAGEPLTDLERFDATNSARIVGQRGGTVPAEPWTTLILRYEATVAALTAERGARGQDQEH